MFTEQTKDNLWSVIYSVQQQKYRFICKCEKIYTQNQTGNDLLPSSNKDL